MFGRPSSGRVARNLGRRPIPSRFPANDSSRALFRQLIRDRGSDPHNEAYIIEIREGPAVNGNTNAAVGKSIPQPWVTVRDATRPNRSAGLPVSVCESLLQHLLTCTAGSDTLEDTDECASPDTDLQVPSPAEASGDATSIAINESTLNGDASPAKISENVVDHKCFHLSLLKPIRIVCEATGCTIEVTAKDPTAKQKATDEHDKVVQQPDPSRRWLVSAPLDGEFISEDAPSGRTYKQPWETCGYIELHDGLLSRVCAFFSDVVTRYRSLSQLPEVRSLYSASGGRRFFFDLRDTRWGKRLHISQVTDLHRNVIGVPLETLVEFRDRLDVIIQRLHLEDQHNLRTEIYAPNSGLTNGNSGADGRRRPLMERSSYDDSRDGAVMSPESAPSSVRKTAAPNGSRPLVDGHQRGRPRRYPPRSNDVVHNAEDLVPPSRRAGSRGAPDDSSSNVQRTSEVGGPRNRRFLRRNNNRSGYTSRGGKRLMHTKSSSSTKETGDYHDGDDVPSSTIAGSEGEPEPQQPLSSDEPEPATLVGPSRMAVVAEASA